MGWWPWPSSSAPSSTADRTNETPSTPTNFGLTNDQKLRIFGPSASQSPPQNSSQIPQSREEQADAELDAFLRSFAASPATQHDSTSDQSTSTDSVSKPDITPVQPPPEYNRILPDGSLNVHPSALHPRTMSCRAAFDQAFYCQSLGGKFNDIYRFGQLQNCSEQWSAFWFCMRTRTLPDAEKQNQIREFYEQRDARRKTERGSSEDVWEIRTKAVTAAFGKDPDAEELFEPLVRG